MPIRLSTGFGAEGYFQQHRFVALFEKIGDGEWFEKHLIELKLPSLSFTASEFWDGMVKNRLVTSGEYSSLGMSFYCSLEKGMDPVYKWIHAHLEHSHSPFGSPDTKFKVKFKKAEGTSVPGYKRDIIVKLLAPDGTDVNTWYFYGCQLSSVNFDQLSYRSDAVLTVSIEVIPDRVVLPTGASMQAGSSSDTSTNAGQSNPQQDAEQAAGGGETANTGEGTADVNQNALGGTPQESSPYAETGSSTYGNVGGNTYSSIFGQPGSGEMEPEY